MLKALYVATAVAVLLAGCTADPKNIVLGPEPLKQMAAEGEKIRKLPESDRVVLAQYLTAYQMGKLIQPNAAESPILTGRTVGEVLVLAQNWQKDEAEKKAEEARIKAEALAKAAELKARVEAEKKEIIERLANSATVVVTGKEVLPENYRASRYSPLLMISYAVENKSDKQIKQLKGTVKFTDAVGAKIGTLPVNFTEAIKPGATLKTDTGLGWKVSGISRGDIEKIAGANNDLLTSEFEVEIIAFDDGEVLKLPD